MRVVQLRYTYLVCGTTKIFKFSTKIQLCTNLYNSKTGTTIYKIVELEYSYNYMLLRLSCFSCLSHLKCVACSKHDGCTFFCLVVPVVPVRVILPYLIWLY